MRKRKYLVLTLALLGLAILRFTANGYDIGLSNASSSASTQNISTLGTISYPTLNATPNLAVIPDDWWLTYGSGPQIIFLDYSVIRTVGQPSIRLEPHTANDVNIAREVDGTWYPVKPGDHIVAKCWIKTDNSTAAEDANPYNGGRIGIDFYASNGAGGICIVDGHPNTQAEHLAGMVMWNTPTWTLKTWDFIIPSTLYTTNLSTGATIPAAQVSYFVMWMQAIQVEDGTAKGNAWFADAELYLNATTTH
jgi:hypothetical protein